MKFLFIYLLLAAGVSAAGQGLTVKGGTITIPAGSTVTVKGSISTTANGNISNNGTLQASGDFLHDGTLAYSGTGTLELNGSGAQAFTATTFYNLLISGSGAKTPSGAITVSHNLALTSGTLVTTSAAPVTLGTTGTLSETASSYIDGWIQTTRAVAQGSANSFGGLGLTLTANGAAPGSTTVVRGTGSTAVQTGSTHNSIQRVFTVTPSNNSGLNADVAFAYRDGELNSLTESTLILFSSNDGGRTWSWLGQVSRDAASNTVTMNGINSFGKLTLGSSSLPLPLTWLSFTGQALTSANQLQWATANEQNTAYFDVERSLTGNGFSSIGRVGAAGNSTAVHDYAFSDPVASGTFFYRLKQVDIDGTFSYSSTIRLARGVDRTDVTVNAAPNPFASHVTLHFSRGFSKNTHLSLVLTDASGRTVWRRQAILGAGQSQSTLSDLGSLPPGAYFLRVATDEGQHFLIRLQH